MKKIIVGMVVILLLLGCINVNHTDDNSLSQPKANQTPTVNITEINDTSPPSFPVGANKIGSQRWGW